MKTKICLTINFYTVKNLLAVQILLTQIGVDPLHASTVDEHLQIPFPLLAVASQNSPVDIPAHDSRFVVHLQIPSPLLADESQNAPVDSPAHDDKVEVHLQTLLAASQYAPVLKSLHDE